MFADVIRWFTVGVAGLISAVSIGHPSTPARHHEVPVEPVAVGVVADQHLPRTEFLSPRDLNLTERQAAFAEYQAEQKALADAAAAAAAAAQPKLATRTLTRSAPSAAPAPPADTGSGSIQDIIRQAFAPYGQTAIDWGLRVAKCESGYNPNAYNPAGPYYGLFQFAMSTFKSTPYGGGNIYDPVANANAAAWKYSQGGAGAWGCR